MTWKCPLCSELNDDDDLLRCLCGYEKETIEDRREAKECPNCGLITTDTELRCDCGYDFTTSQIKGSYLSQSEFKKSDFGILKQILGPSSDTIWRKLSEELNGKFIIKGKSFNKEGRVEIKHREWTITLDSYHTYYGSGIGIIATRIRAPFITIDGFRFKISEKSFFSKIGKTFGLKYKNIKIGFPQFENNFNIEGNEEEKLIQLFKNSKIRDLIFSIPFSFQLDIKKWIDTYYPENVYDLHFETESPITPINDIKLLKLLFNLFAEILDQLCHIGSACKDDPKVNVI